MDPVPPQVSGGHLAQPCCRSCCSPSWHCHELPSCLPMTAPPHVALPAARSPPGLTWPPLLQSPGWSFGSRIFHRGSWGGLGGGKHAGAFSRLPGIRPVNTTLRGALGVLTSHCSKNKTSPQSGQKNVHGARPRCQTYKDNNLYPPFPWTSSPKSATSPEATVLAWRETSPSLPTCTSASRRGESTDVAWEVSRVWWVFRAHRAPPTRALGWAP